MALDDFSLDPYSVETSNVDAQMKALLAHQLRNRQPVSAHYGDLFSNVLNTIADRSDRNDLMAQKRAISESQQKLLGEALRGMPEDITALVHNPSTRAEGLKSVTEERKRQRELKDWEASPLSKPLGQQAPAGPIPTDMVGGYQAGSEQAPPPNAPSYEELVRLQSHPNARIATAAKNMLEAYYKPHGPNASFRFDPTGNAQAIPGVIENLAKIEEAKKRADATYRVGPEWASRNPAGGITPRSELDMLGGGPRALPLSTGGGMLPATPAYTGGVGSTTQPPSPVPTLNPPPRSGGIPPNPNVAIGAPPEADVMAKILAAAQAQGGQSFQGQIAPGGAAQVQPIPMQAKPPQPVPGASFNPEMQKANIAENSKRQELVADIPASMKLLDDLIKLSPSVPAGTRGVLGKATAAAEEFLTGKPNQTYAKTQEYESKVRQAAYPLLRATFGAQFTQKEGDNYIGTFGDIGTNPEARMRLLMDLKAKGQEKYTEAQDYNKAVQVGADPNQYVKQMKEWRTQQQGNPTNPAAAATPAPTAGARPQFPVEKFDETFMGDLKRNARALPGAIASQGGVDAMKDTYSNLWEGGKQLVGQGDREAWKAEAARQEAKARNDPQYAQAKIVHDIVNPTALIGGTTTKILPAALAAATQGALRPQESLAKQLEEGVVSGTLGGVATGVSKILPSTGRQPGAFATSAPELTQAEKTAANMGVNPTNAQLNPKDVFSKVFGPEANRASSLGQIEKMTESLLKETGSTAKKVTPEVLEAQTTILSDTYKTLFPKNVRAKVGTDEAKALADAIKTAPQVEDLMAKGPKLAAIYNIVQSGTPGRIKLADLHDAWKEVGQVAGGPRSQAAGEIRGVLEDIMTKGMGDKGLKQFKDLNHKWGALEDIKQVYEGGAKQGTGRAQELITPSSLEQWARKLPDSSPVREAAGMVKGLGIKDFKEGAPILEANLTTPGGIAQAITGITPEWMLKGLNYSAANADPAVKALLELLRAGTARGPQEYLPEVRNQNAP